MPEPLRTLLPIGGGCVVLTAALVALLAKAARLADREGRGDRRTLLRVGLIRLWAVLLALSGTALAATLLVQGAVHSFTAPGPRSFETQRWLMRASLACYVPWLVLAMFAFWVAGRWLRPAVRSVPALRKADGRFRLWRLRVRRSPPVTKARAFVRRWDRPLWGAARGGRP